MGLSRFGNSYFRKLDGRIAVSVPAREFIGRHYPADYKVIPNGVNVDTFANAEPFEHLRDGKTNLLWVGRMDRRKGLRYLLAAYARLKWDWPDLRLIVVGPGEPDTDSYRIMSERNLTDIEFVGPVPEADKARYFKSADVYCTPATGQESFGIVLLEAMAASKPIVATSIAGYSGVMKDGVEGLLVPPNDGEALADAIARLLKDPALRLKLGETGRQNVEAFRWESVADRVLDYYVECSQ
jgi:phosphatidylinositol alpha-mannosyltransferase